MRSFEATDSVLVLGTSSGFLNGLNFCPLRIPFLTLPAGILWLFFLAFSLSSSTLMHLLQLTQSQALREPSETPRSPSPPASFCLCPLKQQGSKSTLYQLKVARLSPAGTNPWSLQTSFKNNKQTNKQNKKAAFFPRLTSLQAHCSQGAGRNQPLLPDLLQSLWLVK